MSSSPTEFDEHLARLEHDDPSPFGPVWIASAAFFAGLAESNTDISRAVPALLNAYHESHQIPVIEAMARSGETFCGVALDDYRQQLTAMRPRQKDVRRSISYCRAIFAVRENDSAAGPDRTSRQPESLARR